MIHIQLFEYFFQELYDTAENVKASKESHRLKVLIQDLNNIDQNLKEMSTCLPLSPSMQICGIQTKSCYYFPSNTLPLKINFHCLEPNVTIPAIFKVRICSTILWLLIELFMYGIKLHLIQLITNDLLIK